MKKFFLTSSLSELNLSIRSCNFVLSNFICFYEKYERKASSLTNIGISKKKLSSNDRRKEKDNSFFQALIGKLSGQEKGRIGTEKIELIITARYGYL